MKSLLVIFLLSCAAPKELKEVDAMLINIHKRKNHQVLVYRHNGKQYVAYRSNRQHHKVGDYRTFKVKK